MWFLKEEEREDSKCCEKDRCKHGMCIPYHHLMLRSAHTWRRSEEGYANRGDTCNVGNNVTHRVKTIGEQKNANSAHAANKHIAHDAVIVAADRGQDLIASR